MLLYADDLVLLSERQFNLGRITEYFALVPLKIKAGKSKRMVFGEGENVFDVLIREACLE